MRDSADRPTAGGTPRETTNWWTRLERAVSLLAAASVIVVAGFTYTSIRQVNNEQKITRDSQFTDRYNDAVGNFDKDKSVDVRLGGIYALQRLIQDSPRDQSTVIDVLSAYVRTHALPPKKGTKGAGRPESDVVAALSVLGTRDPRLDGARHPDLTGAYLYGADLEGANLTRTNLTNVNLEKAGLIKAKLVDAILDDGVNLKNADLRWADLTNADLDNLDLSAARMEETNFTNASMTKTKFGAHYLRNLDLTKAFLSHADLSKADLSAAHLHDAALFGMNLTGRDLTWADLHDALLKDVNLTDADLSCADLRGAHLDAGSIRGVDLEALVRQLLTARLDAYTSLEPYELAEDQRLKDRMKQGKSEQGNGECNDDDNPFKDIEWFTTQQPPIAPWNPSGPLSGLVASRQTPTEFILRRTP